MVSEGRPIILRAVPEQDTSSVKPFRLLTIAVPPVDVSTVATYPDNLGKLEEQLNEWGSELLKPLTDAVYEAIPSDGIRPTSGKGEGLLILLWIPRLRNGETERTDVMGYVVQSSLGELATALDMLAPKMSEEYSIAYGFLADQLVPSGDIYHFYQLKYVRL